jgi:type IV secretion system protein VirB11
MTPAADPLSCHASAAAAVERSSLEHYLVPLRPLLDDERVTELCINRPHEAFIESDTGWRREALPFASFDWCFALARLIANYTRQRITADEPLLSATLPSGERIQVVLPPAAEDGTVSITIRRPASAIWTLEQLQAKGMFDAVAASPAAASGSRDATVCELACLLADSDHVAFLRRAVQLRQNILLSGATGSGKTTISKALILEVPSDERLITIEDVKELSLRNQPNHVRLFYSHGGQGLAAVTAGQLLASAKRQRPDRVFVSELRTGDEVYDYLVSVNSGHPGSITSVHADSAEMAFVALAQLLKRSEAGRGMSTREGIELAQLSIDVVVQCRRLAQRRFVSEVWYDPSTKRGRLV